MPECPELAAKIAAMQEKIAKQKKVDRALDARKAELEDWAPLDPGFAEVAPGSPVFHGTRKGNIASIKSEGFKIPRKSRDGTPGDLGSGVYFSPSKAGASAYGDAVVIDKATGKSSFESNFIEGTIPANAHVLEFNGTPDELAAKLKVRPAKLQQELKSRGYDGYSAKALGSTTDELEIVIWNKSVLDEISGTKKPRAKFKMMDGTTSYADPEVFAKDLDSMTARLGEDELKKTVQSIFDNKITPRGEVGLNINYKDLDFNEENLNQALVMMGARRAATKGGQDLMMQFTAEVATEEFMAQLTLQGGNPEDMLASLSRDAKKVANLPLAMVQSKRLKMDSSRKLADELTQYAGQIKEGGIGVTDRQKAGLLNMTRFAIAFEELDATLSRKVGQALRARQFRGKEIDVDGLLGKVTYDGNESFAALQEGSLASQILKAIETGDAASLERVARAKRLGADSGASLTEPNFFTQLRLLNSYRKGNLFSSPATFIQRNVVSGALVNASYMMEDVYEGAFRVGARDGFKAAQYASAQAYQGFSSAWSNAMASLTKGEATFTRAELKEGVDIQSLQNRKQAEYDRLNYSWDKVVGADRGIAPGNVVATMNLLNSGARIAIGSIVEKIPGARKSTAGYSPSFSLLAAGDEINRTMAFQWKSSHESYLQAVEEWNELADTAGRSKSDWVAKRTNELVDKAVFKGAMTDDELAKLRRTIGAKQYSDMSNETLRLKLMNDQNGMPNPMSPAGKAGLERGADVTFTQKLKDPVLGGVQQMRQNPIVGWMAPVFQTPINGLKWTVSRDLLFNIADSLRRESIQGMAKVKGKELPYTGQQMAKDRARALNAVFIATATQALWQGGLFTDGGPFNPENRKLTNSKIPPYSFSLGGTAALGFSKLLFPGASIDLVDLMGLQADVMRAFSEGVMTEGDQNRLMNGITQAYARAVENKNSLGAVLDILSALGGLAQGREVQWGRIMRSNMNGILPLSGLLTSGSRGFTDADLIATDRRQMTPTELEAIGKDPNYALFEDFAQTVARGYPLLGLPGAKLRHRDWMGRERQKPFGLPWDATSPFAPIVIKDKPLDQWLVKHGFGGVPNSDGRLGSKELGTGNFATMSVEEENDYRENMWSSKGEIPAEMILGQSNTFISTGLYQYDVNRFVQGRTLEEALTSLSVDPSYNADLNTPNSPSLTQNMGDPISERSLSQRKQGQKGNDPRQVYKVYNAIVNYYSWHGAQRMMQLHPDFAKKAMANQQIKQKAGIEDLMATPLGLSRQ